MLTQHIDRKAIKARHVNQVQRAKQIIADAAAALIKRQLESAAAELRETGTAKLNMVFRPRDWDQPLKEALGPPIARVMLIGAASELERHRRVAIIARPKKSTASDLLAELGIDLEDLATELPQELIDRIEATLADSFRREYWQRVNNTTASTIQDLLARGTSQGLSIRDMAKQLQEFAPEYSKLRATAIARTESSRALNSGHVDGIRELERETGITFGKTWLSVLGNTTRPEHAALDGVTVAADAPFYLAGYACQFPSDADLPPEHAINCLCTVISGTLDEGE